MPRFYFHVTDGHAFAYDHEGTEVISEEIARGEALDGARHLLAQGDRRGLCRRHWEMTVANQEDEPMFKLAFAHALQSDRLNTADVIDLRERSFNRPA